VPRSFPPNLIDNRVLWDLNAQNTNALFGATLNSHRASIGLPPVDNVFGYAYTDHPWLAADSTLGPWQQPADLEVVQTGAWLLLDERPLSAELVAFLDAGTPPVYVGFGSMPLRVSKDIARGPQRRSARKAAARCSPRAGRAWPPSTTRTTASPDQLYWAGRVADLGIGAAHAGPIPTLESLSGALTTALTPETRARASAVAGDIRTDGAMVAATLLIEAISRESPPGDPARPAPPR
jgi:vancomycin aglycone glucosyltransferase